MSYSNSVVVLHCMSFAMHVSYKYLQASHETDRGAELKPVLGSVVTALNKLQLLG